jgi:hypothetical protein
MCRQVRTFLVQQRGTSDLLVLATLNLAAGHVSWDYTSDVLHFPQAFAVAHFFSALLLYTAALRHTVIPAALAVTSGVFFGRALGLAVAYYGGSSPFISISSLFLSAMTWVTLAWIVRPTSLLVLRLCHLDEIFQLHEDL